MDRRYLLLLFLIELIKLVFTIVEMASPRKFDQIYNVFDQDPAFENNTYKCFVDMNHCRFRPQSSPVKTWNILYIIASVVSMLNYLGLIYLIRKKSYGKRFKVSCVVAFTLDACTLIVSCIHFSFIGSMLKACARYTTQIQIENLIAYIIIDLTEMAYIGFDWHKMCCTADVPSHIPLIPPINK